MGEDDLKININDFRKKMYESRRSSPMQFFHLAQLFHRAATLLRRPNMEAQTKLLWEAGGSKPLDEYAEFIVDIELVKPIAMLEGLSIELMLKAIIFKNNDAEFDKRTRSHSLCDLAHAAAITMNDDETDLLERLGRAVVWSGRYPTPNKIEEFDTKSY